MLREGKQMKFSFVILNYNTFNETKKCIENINKLKNDFATVIIIIIDNCSTDDSLSKLLNKYSNTDNIEIISMEYNVGFAKGNNIGYTVAKYKYNSDYIVILNSDVYIQSLDFLTQVHQLYVSNHYDILGPKISDLIGNDQNPIEYVHDSVNKINKTLILNLFRYIYYFLNFYKNKVSKIRKTDLSDEVDVPLHGSCLIYSNNYTKHNEFAFYPDTFLYGEEDFLFYLSKKKDRKLLYSPSIHVIHAEDAASNSINRNIKEKKLFVLKNSTSSLKKLKKLIKNMEE